MHRGTHFFGCIKSFLTPSKSGSLDPVDDEPGLFPPHVRSYGHKDGVTRRPVSNAERGITQEHTAHSLPAAPRQPPADRHPGELRLPPSPSCSGSALSPAPGRPTASGHTRAGLFLLATPADPALRGPDGLADPSPSLHRIKTCVCFSALPAPPSTPRVWCRRMSRPPGLARHLSSRPACF